MTERGLISDIQHFSTGDGPGIRTTVFFKGCSLRCVWCHNPETISKERQLMFYDNLCISCGKCQQVCPYGLHIISNEGHSFDNVKCKACGACEDNCSEKALNLCGKELSLDKVMSYILEDRDFYEISGGGVTLSGGEPLLQYEFCSAIAKECKAQNLHVIIDTAGNVDYKAFLAVIPYTDVFYFDVKANSEQDYANWTGGSFVKIISNLKQLISDGCNVVVRIPVIPGFNDGFDYCESLAHTIKMTGAQCVDLLSFHRLGAGKYNALGKVYSCSKIDPPSNERMLALKEIFINNGFSCKIES